ncbi:MAG: hypothetical protein RBS39_08665 [Phycisphaerales bacterium]|jgi:hypothetical protein|nr:hypothetical protein [Phycisphaerales bacterium]
MSVQHRRGYAALVGLLVVVVIILVLMVGLPGGGSSSGSGGSGGSASGGGSGVGGVLGAARSSRNTARQAKLSINSRAITDTIVAYQVQNGSLPHSWEDLGIAPMLDPWGQAMRFECLSERGKASVTIYSDGPDGEPGTDDDQSETHDLPI